MTFDLLVGGAKWCVKHAREGCGVVSRGTGGRVGDMYCSCARARARVRARAHARVRYEYIREARDKSSEWHTS